MGERLGRTPELHAAADVVAIGSAELALATRKADLECNAVSDSQAVGIGPDGDDGAAGLVAEGQRLAHEDVAVAEVREVVQVGAAQARGLDGDLDFGGGGGSERAVLLRGVNPAGLYRGY